jgi:hypothetical protein
MSENISERDAKLSQVKSLLGMAADHVADAAKLLIEVNQVQPLSLEELASLSTVALAVDDNFNMVRMQVKNRLMTAMMEDLGNRKK